MGKILDEALAAHAQAKFDEEDEILLLRQVQTLLANADRRREELAAARNAVKQAERRLEEAELAVRCELRRMPRRRGAP